MRGGLLARTVVQNPPHDGVRLLAHLRNGGHFPARAARERAHRVERRVRGAIRARRRESPNPPPARGRAHPAAPRIADQALQQRIGRHGRDAAPAPYSS